MKTKEHDASTPIREPASVEQRVEAFLTARAGLDFCDECLAWELGERRHLTRIAASWLAMSARFHRGPWVCSRCGRDREVTRARASITSDGALGRPRRQPAA